jgi:hypothetical protein
MLIICGVTHADDGNRMTPLSCTEKFRKNLSDIQYIGHDKSYIHL